MPYSDLDTVKEWLGIELGQSDDDDALTAALSAGDSMIDEYCGRDFVVPSATSERTFRPVDDTTLRLPETLTKLDDLAVTEDLDRSGSFATAVASTDYYVLEDVAPFRTIVRDVGRWHQPVSGRPTVRVTGFYGYAETVPAAVVQASTMLAARLFQRRSSPLGFATGVSSEFGAVRIGRVDPDVPALLAGFRRIGVA